MSDYTKVKAGLHRQANAFHPESLVATTSTEALAAIEALEAEVARMRGALTKAANRLDWAAGIIESDTARDNVSAWADEARAALTTSG